MATISFRRSIRFIPGPPPHEPTSTIVLTSAKLKKFVDLRALPGEDILYWGIAGTSHHDAGTGTGRFVHEIDSRSDEPEEDVGVFRELESGETLETGVMRDFGDGVVKRYEEVWRDVVAVGPVVVMECGTPQVKGCLVRVREWCQAIVKTVAGEVSAARWRLEDEQDMSWRLMFRVGDMLPLQLPLHAVEPRAVDPRVDGGRDRVGDKEKLGGADWVVIETSVS